jgi:hypothetical protein
MNRDSTIISMALIATGVATCLLLGNPQMDGWGALQQSAAEKSLQPPVYRPEENAAQKLEQIEAEMAMLKAQMDMLSKRLAESRPTLVSSDLQKREEVNRGIVFDKGPAILREGDGLLAPVAEVLPGNL